MVFLRVVFFLFGWDFINDHQFVFPNKLEYPH